MRLVHLAPMSKERSIRRSGLSGGFRTFAVHPEGATMQARVVCSMPVLPDFWTTHQWLRELRRSQDGKMVAVYFRVPDTEEVYVGRYGQQQRVMGAAAAADW